MISREYHLKFIMPCFCAGADQGRAELRSSSARGALRWWFRALGGTPSEENEVFGCIAETSEKLRSSAIILRTEITKQGVPWELPAIDPKNFSSYIWHFVSKSGGKSGESETKAPGPRWSKTAFIPQGTEWTLHFLQRRNLTEELQKKLEETLDCFLVLGSIGLRITRGLGAFVCKEQPFCLENVRQILETKGFKIEVKSSPQQVEQMAETIGGLVKGTRKSRGWRNDSEHGSETPSPMGTSKPRQTSAIYFRPVSLESGKMQLVIFEAPHKRVLCEEARVKEGQIVGHQPSWLTMANSNSRH